MSWLWCWNAGIYGAASFLFGVSFLSGNDEIEWVIFPRWIECFDFSSVLLHLLVMLEEGRLAAVE